jgi:hypothetical protein
MSRNTNPRCFLAAASINKYWGRSNQDASAEWQGRRFSSGGTQPYHSESPTKTYFDARIRRAVSTLRHPVPTGPQIFLFRRCSYGESTLNSRCLDGHFTVIFTVPRSKTVRPSPAPSLLLLPNPAKTWRSARSVWKIDILHRDTSWIWVCCLRAMPVSR